MQNSIQDITGVTVCSGTRSLIETCYNSVRQFHPDMRIIIIDGSKPSDECYRYVRSLASGITTTCMYGSNIGHGRGMDAGINMVKTKFALVFDSDVVMLKSPVEQMLVMMEEDTYGVGAFDYVDDRGFGKNNHDQEWRNAATKYLHPYFQLINVSVYKQFHPYVHHGAPCFLAMNEIKRKGLSDRILKEFPGASIYGTTEYLIHHTDGTRSVRRSHGLPEIEGNWQRNENRSTRAGSLNKLI